MMSPSTWTTAVVLAVAVSRVDPLAAQSAPDTTVVYRREVFHYDAAGRPDPFRSLLDDEALGVRVEDLQLRGVVFHPEEGRSVAVLQKRGAARPLRVRVGHQLGTLRVAAIRPRSVDLLVTEFGVTHQRTLELPKDPEPGAVR